MSSLRRLLKMVDVHTLADTVVECVKAPSPAPVVPTPKPADDELFKEWQKPGTLQNEAWRLRRALIELGDANPVYPKGMGFLGQVVAYEAGRTLTEGQRKYFNGIKKFYKEATGEEFV